MPRRRPPQEFVIDQRVPDDGIRPVREAFHWTRDKLGILSAYFPAYGRACKTAGQFFFVDAMAGSGLCHIRDTDEFLRGSTLLALNSVPAFARSLSLEVDPRNAAALRARTALFGSRVVVLESDCNAVLGQAMLDHIPRRSPTFVLLDPEGAELDWGTVRAAASHRLGARKAELLILFATEGINRMLPVETEIEDHNERRLDQMFPPAADWRAVWQQRRAGLITPGEAREQYVATYRAGLLDLKYRTVIHRRIARTNGALVYHLLFATDDAAGERIMNHVFQRMESNRPQLSLL